MIQARGPEEPSVTWHRANISQPQEPFIGGDKGKTEDLRGRREKAMRRIGVKGELLRNQNNFVGR